MPYVKTGISPARGSEAHTTVVLNVSAPDAGLPTSREPAPRRRRSGKAIYNKASVTTKGDGQSAEARIRGTPPAKSPVQGLQDPARRGPSNSDGTPPPATR